MKTVPFSTFSFLAVNLLPGRDNWLAVRPLPYLTRGQPGAGIGRRQHFFARRYKVSDCPGKSGSSYLFHIAMVTPWLAPVTRQWVRKVPC